MIAVLMREEHAVELLGFHSAKLEPRDELPRAQAPIDQQPAMIGRDQGCVPGAAAAEHGEAKHSPTTSESPRHSQTEKHNGWQDSPFGPQFIADSQRRVFRWRDS